MRPSRTHLALILVTAAALCACALDASDKNACRSDADCVPGTYCDGETCVTLSTTTTTRAAVEATLHTHFCEVAGQCCGKGDEPAVCDRMLVTFDLSFIDQARVQPCLDAVAALDCDDEVLGVGGPGYLLNAAAQDACESWFADGGGIEAVGESNPLDGYCE